VLEIVMNAVALSGLKNAYVELICTRGCSPTFSRDPREAINRFMVFVVPFSSVANPEQLQRGLHVAVAERTRIPPSSVDPSIKNYHWLDLVAGLYDAYEKRAETALLLDDKGGIAEGPGFNVFIVKDGQLATPDYSVLPGITRRTVMDLCQELALPCSARALSPQELTNADEVFITSTAGGVMPVTKVNQNNIGDGLVGPICKRIQQAYWDKHTDNEWSTLVLYPDD
uniref:aminotransferase class IV n=1 Tax=Neptunomonas sp. TaxID=1971898 RepID=UPI0025E54E18